MLTNVLMIANPGSGKGVAVEYAERLKVILEETYQANVNLLLTEAEGDAEEWSAKAYGDGFDTVICLGGDGTVREVVQGIVRNENRPYFGFVPMGTVNDLARALGYSMNADEAIEMFRQVQLTTLDVAQVNGRCFINVLAIGSVPESVMNTDSDDKNRFGFLAYVKDAVGHALNNSHYHLQITDSKGNVTELETDLLIVGLTNSVGGYENMFSFASHNDGRIHLAAVKGTGLLDVLKVAIEGGITEEETDNLFVLSDTAIQIKSTQNEEVTTNIDGDEGPSLPIELKVIPQALQVIVPAE